MIGKNPVFGELTLSDWNTSLYLWSYNWDDVYNNDCFAGQSKDFIGGDLDDLTRVSLIQCFVTEGPGRRARASRTETGHYIKFQPNYVVFGEQHISPDEDVICSIHFLIEDGNKVFRDYDSFGQLIDARPLIKQVIELNSEQLSEKREIEVGPHPQIAYFTGKRDLFSANTHLGKVSAYRSVSYSFGKF